MLKTVQALAGEALAFLKQQQLPATPQNYALAYLAKDGSSPVIGQAVEAITDGGVRMTQAEADEIFAMFLAAALPVSGAATQDTARDTARHQTLRLTEIAAGVAAATGSFNYDLGASFGQLGSGTADVTAIVAAMLERSRRAERELAATVQEAEALRQELDTARDDATKDVLTGLGNRRAIDARLAALAKTGEPRLIAICDIDHFKSINDRYGHAVGDRVLRTVAGVLAEACAPHLVGRWGGEEFLVVMPETALADGLAIMEAARAKLEARQFKLRETDEPLGAITFSAGLSQATGDDLENRAALGRADKLLYRAKTDGRNRVIAG